MTKRLSQYFGVPAEELTKRGVLNGFLGIDNKLFVDPNLLKTAETDEFTEARTQIEEYFANIIKLLSVSKGKGDAAWREAARRLVFREQAGIALGYAGASTSGSGIGPELAGRLVERASEIVALGITDPLIFELIGLFEEDFGPDRLSDMSISILLHAFLGYTQRITAELALNSQTEVVIRGNKWSLPVGPDGKPLLLVPAELLNDLPIALDRSEIEEVAAFNSGLRAAWNAIVASASKRRSVITKQEIRKMLFSDPSFLADLVQVYRNAAARGYDFETDPEGLFDWFAVGYEAAKANPLKLDIKAPKSVKDLLAIIDAIARQFKKNIEENKLYEFLYRDDGRPRRELYAQRLFYACADAYCIANGVELSREPNAGNGPVDFKVSGGGARVLVELKLSKNDLVHGYTVQLPAYQKSEAADDAVYVIIRISERDAAIKDVQKIYEDGMKAGKNVPRVYVIDARRTESASKRPT